ncbi:MAG: Uma2 family endonuclease [Methylomonas sp.]
MVSVFRGACGIGWFGRHHGHFSIQPKLIIETQSDETERYDRSEKFHHYRKLANLEEYVLIAQDTQRVERYLRAGICRFTSWR